MHRSIRRAAAISTLALATSLLLPAPARATAEHAPAGTVDVTAQLGYAIPVIDLDFENFGGLPATVGAGYAVSDGLLLGVRGRFDYMFLDTDADLRLWIIDADATLGWFVWRGLLPYLALGLTIVGDSYAGDVAHDPYFGAAIGLSFTFRVTRLGRADFGIEVGAEVAMMFHPDFRRTETMAGTWNDGVFAYPIVFVGGRFSMAPGAAENEASDDN
jgi:hypothetical protein